METTQNRNKKQKGVAAIITALCLTVLLGIAAISIDLGTYFVRNNELQNAADAGALAGGRLLYDPINYLINANGFINEEGHWIESANRVARDTAIVNVAQKTAVEVYLTTAEDGDENHNDVRRGHWSFKTRTFTPSDATVPIKLANYTFDELDVKTDFVNAIEVTTRRKATPLVSFFSRIFGHSSLEMKTKAIAYLGFSGEILPGEADLPIVICEDSILINGVYECNIGRMINSGSNLETNDTARWTSFETTNQCQENVNVNNSELVDLISCDPNSGGNPETIFFGEGLATNNGEMSVLSNIQDCFTSLLCPDGSRQSEGIYCMWRMTLPVAHCTKEPGCAIVVGAVSVYIAWVNYNQSESHYEDVPKFMYAPLNSDGGPILDEDGHEIYSDWPGDIVEGVVTYNNVEAVWTDGLIPFMLDLENVYRRNDFDDLETQILNVYDPAVYGDWRDPSNVYLFFTDQEGISDDNIDGKVRWASFIYHWGLENIRAVEDEWGNEILDGDGNIVVETVPAPWNGSAIYFLPSCDKAVPKGVTGGKNYGVLAKVPLLVD